MKKKISQCIWRTGGHGGEIKCYKGSCFDLLFPLEATSVFKSLPRICN